MPIKELHIEDFLSMSKQHLVLDVRSPGEYVHAQIPGAVSLPLFSDEERRIIGTTYKTLSKEKAIKEGLDFFGVKMRGMVEKTEKLFKMHQPEEVKEGKGIVLLHCWRGGMRSGAVAWLLSFYGFDCYVLKGGYKAYRNYVLQQFEKNYHFNILGGYTGSGKTLILQQLAANGHTVIDLEAIACHKGSAFGGIGQPVQPTQEMFENLLALQLENSTQPCTGGVVWLEDESQRIGKLNIPHALWKSMRESTVYFLDIPFNERLDYILEGYSSLDKQSLADAIIRIQKRLGPMETKTAIACLQDGNIKACFDILLQYYDKNYRKSLLNRENTDLLLNKIPCFSVDTISNIEKLDACRLQLK